MPKFNQTSTAYIIRTLSPLHMGKGDASYGVIDKLVQRDSLTNYPVLHSSGIKGAMREFFEYWLEDKYDGDMAKKNVDLIFGKGTQTNEENNESDYAAGLYDFDLGFLLSLPVRSSHAAYVSTTTQEILTQFLERLKLFGLNTEHAKASAVLQPLLDLELGDSPCVFSPGLEGAVLEDEDIKAKYAQLSNLSEVEKLLGKNPALVPPAQFADLADSLPVIARNKLDNGQSKNLWYEETVPRESRFFTIITKASWENGDHSKAELNDLFDGVVNGNRIQLGGNATVGYGKTIFTNFQELIN